MATASRLEQAQCIFLLNTIWYLWGLLMNIHKHNYPYKREAAPCKHITEKKVCDMESNFLIVRVTHGMFTSSRLSRVGSVNCSIKQWVRERSNKLPDRACQHNVSIWHETRSNRSTILHLLCRKSSMKVAFSLVLLTDMSWDVWAWKSVTVQQSQFDNGCKTPMRPQSYNGMIG